MPGESFSSAARAVVERLRVCWRFKAVLTVLLNLFFWLGYGYLAHHAIYPVWTPPVTWVDQWVPFQPQGWSLIYLSELALTPIVPWLLTTREELRRYAIGLAFLSGSSFLLFLFCPVASPRPAEAIGSGWHRVILEWDGPYNAFPSLHAGFVVYTVLLARRTFPSLPKRYGWVWLAVFCWAVLVMVSTLATRQHYVIDLVAGAVLGLLAHALSGVGWVRRPLDSAAKITLRRKGATSQAGSK
jgi:membrane-associated phospholipid phosphatase